MALAKCKQHDICKIGLMIVTLGVYIVVLVFNQFASRKIIFPNDIGSISRNFPLDITPLSIVFPIIWSTIYLWQAAWIIYTFTFLLRRSQDGSLVYRKIDVLNNGLFVAFTLCNFGMIAWLFFWSYKFLEWSFVTLTFLTFCLYIAFYIALRISYLFNDDLTRLRLNVDIILMRALTQNGLAFFLTWTTIASSLNMATYLTYELGVDMSIATTTALLIICALITIYFVIENFVWQRYLLYVFTPWCVILIALSTSLVKNWTTNSSNNSITTPTRNNIITLVILVLAVGYTAAKLVMFGLYQTVCKPSIDKRESHKLLQAKENQSSTSSS